MKHAKTIEFLKGQITWLVALNAQDAMGVHDASYSQAEKRSERMQTRRDFIADLEDAIEALEDHD